MSGGSIEIQIPASVSGFARVVAAIDGEPAAIGVELRVPSGPHLVAVQLEVVTSELFATADLRVPLRVAPGGHTVLRPLAVLGSA